LTDRYPLLPLGAPLFIRACSPKHRAPEHPQLARPRTRAARPSTPRRPTARLCGTFARARASAYPSPSGREHLAAAVRAAAPTRWRRHGHPRDASTAPAPAHGPSDSKQCPAGRRRPLMVGDGCACSGEGDPFIALSEGQQHPSDKKAVSRVNGARPAPNKGDHARSNTGRNRRLGYVKHCPQTRHAASPQPFSARTSRSCSYSWSAPRLCTRAAATCATASRRADTHRNRST